MPERENINENDRLDVDQTNINKLLRELNVNIKSFEMSRIGKQTGSGRPRPIRVEFSKETEKYEVLKKAPNMRFTDKKDFKKLL